MEAQAPLFDKVHRARMTSKLEELIRLASRLQTMDDSTNRDALLSAIPRLYRRAALVVGAYGFGLEGARIDGMLASRRATLLATRDGKQVDAVVDLVQLIEDLQFLVADNTSRLPPLIAPEAPKPIVKALPPVKPVSRPAAPKAIPTLKLPKKTTKR